MTPSPSVAREPRVAIIGAGMSGLLAGIELRRAGITSFTIFEKERDLGGTWRDNRYPGLTCDVPSLLYTYSFELSPSWSRRYPSGPEIHAYFRRVAEAHDIPRRIRFGAEVTSATWDGARWRVASAGLEPATFDFVIAACGALHRPRLPAIEGLDSFAGRAFHTARWPDGLDLTGQRVGIVGTGSTSAQVVPEVAKVASHLAVFQRTAQWMFPMSNPEVDARARARLARHPRWLRLRHELWRIGFELGAHAQLGNPLLLAWIAWSCRRNLAQVRDPELRRKLTPAYRAGCKRLVISEGFYPAIQRDNVRLVTEPIRRVVAEGVQTEDGEVHPLDSLVLATGFDAHAYVRPARVTGAGGITVDELWRDGVFAYRTMALPGFPNFFFLIGPHSPIGNYSVISVAEVQMRYVMEWIERWRRGTFACASPTADATRRFNQRLRAAFRGTIWVSGCKSWYLDRHGNPILWPWPLSELRHQLRHPVLDDFELTPVTETRS